MSYNEPDEQYYQYLKQYGEKHVKNIDGSKQINDMDASCCKHAEELEKQLKQCQSTNSSTWRRPLTRGRLTYKPSDEWLEKNFMRKKKNDGSLTDFGGGGRKIKRKLTYKRRRTNKKIKIKRGTYKRTNKRRKRTNNK